MLTAIGKLTGVEWAQSPGGGVLPKIWVGALNEVEEGKARMGD